MFRTMRQFGAGTAFVIVLSSLTLVGCNQTANPTPDPLGPAVITPGPSPTGFIPTPPTAVPVSGPTLAESDNVALSILNAMPQQIGRFTIDKSPTASYVAKSQQGAIVGVVVTYTISGGARLVYAIWITQDANYAVDRYGLELQRLAVPAIPVEVGDQAFLAPTNKGRDDTLAFNPAQWAESRFRNIVIDVYPTKTLTDQTSTTQDEARQLLQAALNAIPK